MLKRYVISLLTLVFMLVMVFPAWGAMDTPQFGEDGLLIPGQGGDNFYDTSWWVDEDKVLHCDNTGRDEGYPGSHTVVGRFLTYFCDLREYLPDVIEVQHNVCSARAVGNIISMPISAYEIFSVDGIPFWRWVEQNPEAQKRYDYQVRQTSSHSFYEALKCEPGQKKVELWGGDHEGNYSLLVGALHSYDKVEPYYLPVRPFEEYGTTYVPVRGVLDKLGAEISWNAEQGAAVFVANGNTAMLKPDDSTALVNGTAVKMSAAPKIINSRMMIPLRFVSETLGYTVHWQPYYAVKQIIVETKN